MYDIEEQSDIIGKSCTLLNPYKGYTEGTIVGDYGNRIIVCLTSGKEISEYRSPCTGNITEQSSVHTP